MKREKYFKIITFLLPIVFLLVISLLDMYGASFISRLYSSALKKQCIWVVVGIIILIITSKLDIKTLTKSSLIFYIIGVISLVAVLFFGKNVNGANSWFKIGPVSFQPSEIFKVFYLLFLAHIVETSKNKKFLFTKILVATFIPAFLIFLEPDTGVVLLYLLMCLGVLTESGVKKRYIFGSLGLGVGVILIFLGLYFFASDLFIKIFGTGSFYRVDRLLAFSNSSSYQLSNALIGMGASGAFGLGLKSSKIYIPEVTTDFVYSLSILNFGYIVGIIIVLLYTFILYRVYILKVKSKKVRDRVIASGILYMMAFQVAEHILMNLGLTPITGITLPFLSYGGSSLVSYCMLFGLLLKITTNNSSYS